MVLADDHAGFRRGLEEMLLTDGGIEVVGEAADGAEAVEIARQVRPDVVVLDLAMPIMGGREALDQLLRDVSPPPGIVILTMHDGAGQRRELLGMGASAFLAKSASLQEILVTVKGAAPRGHPRGVEQPLETPYIRRSRRIRTGRSPRGFPVRIHCREVLQICIF